MKTGFPCVGKLHRENPVLALYGIAVSTYFLGLVFPNKKLQQNFYQHESLKGTEKFDPQPYNALISFSCVFLIV